MAQFNPDDCKYYNNTDGVCCHEAIRCKDSTKTKNQIEKTELVINIFNNETEIHLKT